MHGYWAPFRIHFSAKFPIASMEAGIWAGTFPRESTPSSRTERGVHLQSFGTIRCAACSTPTLFRHPRGLGCGGE